MPTMMHSLTLYDVRFSRLLNEIADSCLMYVDKYLLDVFIS